MNVCLITSILAKISPKLITIIIQTKTLRLSIPILQTINPSQRKRFKYLHGLFLISLPISIGAGIDFFLSLALYLCILCSDPNQLKRLGQHLITTKRFLALIAIFYLIYWINYEPTIYRRYETLVTSEFNSQQWLTLIGWIILSIFPLFGLDSNYKKIQFIALELMGCVLWSSSIIIYSIINYPPPYYGNLHNPLFGYALNSPGIANLLTMIALLFYGQFLNKTYDLPLFLKIILALCFVFTIWEAIFIEQRTFFIVSFLVCPLLLIYFQFNNRKKNLNLISIIASIPLFYLVFKPFLESNFETYRRLTFNITNDLRFRLYKNWFNQFVEDPFSRVRVNLLENPDYGFPTAEFHNFFMDVSRFSGGSAFILALILFIYIAYGLVRRLNTDPHLGQLLIFLFIPLFLILCTSVFPEGEVQFFLIILSIAALNESAEKNTG